jgi:acyl-CoA dehydrogenase
MDFHLTEEQQMIVDNTRKLTMRYDRKYWLSHYEKGTFTQEMWEAFADLGYLGITIPEAYDGLGLGIFEMSLVQEELAGHGVPSLLLILGPSLSLIPIIRHGTDEQKARWLPSAAAGKEKMCFAMTEPNAGTNTFRIQTFAKETGDHYVLSGQKIFISGVDVCEKMLVVARTETLDKTSRTKGLSLFVIETNAPGVSYSEMDTQIVAPEKQFVVYFDNVRVPKENLVGKPGKGSRYLFDGLNPERILVAATAVGLGRFALNKAVQYAKNRNVFDTPIGSHQGLQHPLAEAKAHLELAALMNRKAAWIFDRKENAGEFANIAKMAAADAALEASDIAIEVHGGNGFAKEYDLMAVYSLCRLFKTAPVSREMILNYIGEHVLALPKSY